MIKPVKLPAGSSLRRRRQFGRHPRPPAPGRRPGQEAEYEVEAGGRAIADRLSGLAHDHAAGEQAQTLPVATVASAMGSAPTPVAGACTPGTRRR